MKNHRSFREMLQRLKEMNDEIYSNMETEEEWMYWIEFVPDQASEEELADIAADENYYNEVVECFNICMKYYRSK